MKSFSTSVYLFIQNVLFSGTKKKQKPTAKMVSIALMNVISQLKMSWETPNRRHNKQLIVNQHLSG
jgi:hypothetical protein